MVVIKSKVIKEFLSSSIGMFVNNGEKISLYNRSTMVHDKGNGERFCIEDVPIGYENAIPLESCGRYRNIECETKFVVASQETKGVTWFQDIAYPLPSAQGEANAPNTGDNI